MERKRYIYLTQYAREKGVNEPYLRGAIYGIPIDLAVAGNSFVVDEAARKKLDPVAERIKARLLRRRPPSKKPRRSPSPKPAAP